VLFAFAAGEELSEHTSARPTIVHVLQGEADATAGGEAFAAGAGTWFRMAPNMPHSIKARTGLVMALYLLRMRVGTLAFLGTSAWFFLAVNLLKVPFSVGLGLITPDSLRLSAAIAPGILVGALAGRRLVRGMSREVFELAALVATAAAAVWLLVGRG
ncbi:cupin domain-containing protein, partial [Actinotalea sp.]|uniref:cupin domain-containing protein n=1 Tax=Actinotalea sp. TaxID=1872145 RepID=UPI002CAEAA52